MRRGPRPARITVESVVGDHADEWDEAARLKQELEGEADFLDRWIRLMARSYRARVALVVVSIGLMAIGFGIAVIACASVTHHVEANRLLGVTKRWMRSVGAVLLVACLFLVHLSRTIPEQTEPEDAWMDSPLSDSSRELASPRTPLSARKRLKERLHAHRARSDSGGSTADMAAKKKAL